MKQEMIDAINEQINAELYSSYLYLSMSAYFEEKGLAGFANWMRVQAEEEKFHGMKMFDYVCERGGRITLKAIEAPQIDWQSPLNAFEHVYEHEQKVTGLINALMDKAIEHKDHATSSFLNWYIDEQVEEEDSASTMVNKLRMVSDDGRGLLMLDNEMSQRVFTPPVKE